MNLMEESFQNREEKKKKNITTIILIAIILLVVIIVSIAGYLVYLQNSTLKLALNGQQNEKIKQMLVFENDGTIYVPIKEISSHLGYESYNGEYSDKSEEPSKCYVQSENEVANFSLGSNKIYKLDLSKNEANYEYIYTKKPVKAINGVLYTTTEGLEKAFNVSFQYNQDNNRIYIYTLPYLVESYTSRVLDFGYTEISSEFVNQKTILQDMIVVSKENKKYGVIDLQGNSIIEPKYDNITYLPNTGDFLVETNKKVGILSKSKETKVQIIYDSIQLMDSDAGLYVAKKDNKYGVIDIKGNIKIYIENDEIGIDISKFTQNNIKNNYLLADNLIPVRKDKNWGLYDKNGKQVVDFEYDSFGYIASSNKDALNLLVIPNYNVVVACKNKKYTLINSSGNQLFGAVADDIYMTISGGERHYYIAVNDQKMDAEAYLDSKGITSKDTGETSQDKSNSNSNTRNQNEVNNTNTVRTTNETNSSAINTNQRTNNDE
ncbi:MAG: hypothetical protein HFJ40_00380 [Clostridia bacterium]|nr:hypothetical protein [Clostridia bacterium]